MDLEEKIARSLLHLFEYNEEYICSVLAYGLYDSRGEPSFDYLDNKSKEELLSMAATLIAKMRE